MERRERERGGRERREVGLANSVANANGQDGTLSLSLSTVNPEEHRERGRGELRAEGWTTLLVANANEQNDALSFSAADLIYAAQFGKSESMP